MWNLERQNLDQMYWPASKIPIAKAKVYGFFFFFFAEMANSPKSITTRQIYWPVNYPLII